MVALIVYLVPVIQLAICALAYAALRLAPQRAAPGHLSPFILSFGILWLVLALGDAVLAIGWPTPPAIVTYVRLAAALYAHGFLIAVLVIIYLIARPASDRFYAVAIAVAQVLGLVWTEFFRVAIMTVD